MCKQSRKIFNKKIGEHISCWYSISTIWVFDHIENKRSSYRVEDCMKKFCTSLREQATNAIDFEKKKMLLLARKELKPHQHVTVCCICWKRFVQNLAKDKNHRKVRENCHYTGNYGGAAHSTCNLKYNVPNETPVIFHSGSNYHNDFTIKELTNEFEGQFECFRENSGK